MKNGDAEDDLEIYNKKTNFEKESRLNNNLGVIYKRQGNYEEAEKCYKTAIKQDSGQSNQDFFPFYNLAVNLVK